jgi:cytochrome c oxidase subunit 3
MLQVGTVVWLASELMFFSALFGTYFTLRGTATGSWPPPGVDLEPLVATGFTALLVLSSGTMQLAVRAISTGQRVQFRLWLVATAILAMVFLGNQGREWVSADFSPGSHAYGSAFFIMTGFHAIHVGAGVLAMGVLLGRSLDPRFGRPDTASVEVVSYYWHLVDVVWLAMFATLFFIR